MRILVIGGTLFIGKGLVKRLIADGHDVTILHRKADHPFGRKVAAVRADRNDGDSVRRALSGLRFDAVYDLVYDWERGTTAAQVDATARAVPGNLTRYIFMSSVAAYGDGLTHSEDDPLASEAHPDLYVRNKASSERALFRLWHESRFPVVTMRPPFVYGPGNPFYREAFFWDRMRRGRKIIVPGDGNRLMQFVYVGDLVEACLRALVVATAPGRAFNVAEEKPRTQLEVLGALAKVAGVDLEIVKVPRGLIQRMGGNPMGDPMYFGEYYDVPPITEAIGRVKRVLGIKLTPFAAGLKATYAAYRREHPKAPRIKTAMEDQLIAATEALGPLPEM